MRIEKTEVTPECVDYDSTQIGVLNDFFVQEVENGSILGFSYVLARDGKTFAAASGGKGSNIEGENREVLVDSIFPICSITKLFTACAIFKLMELGKLRISQPVCEFIEEWKIEKFNKITIEHLLTHTSGFAVDPGALPHRGPDCYDYIETAFHAGDTDWIRAAMKSEFDFETGTKWGYSSFGFHLLAEIIRRVSGMSEREFIKKYIFVPCDMLETSYEPTPELAKRIMPIDPHWNKMKLYFENKEALSPIDEFFFQLPKGGGGIYSTSLDLIKFGNMLAANGNYNGTRVLGRKTIERMAKVCTKESVKDYCWDAPGNYRRYALGPDMRYNVDNFYSPETFFHEGAGRCNLIIDPTEHMVATYMIPIPDQGVWDPVPVYNTHCIIWAGLM